MSVSFEKKYLADDVIQMKNFLPPEMLQEALSFEIFKTNENYAGKGAELPKAFVSRIVEKLKTYDISFPKFEFGRLRIATHEDIHSFNSLVHVDHPAKQALVIYVQNTLFKDPSQSGTMFWEHSGTKKKKLDIQNQRDVFYNSFILKRDSKDLSKWNEWLRCPFEPNTALLFDSLYYHSPPSPLFEKHSPGMRVTLDLFFS